MTLAVASRLGVTVAAFAHGSLLSSDKRWAHRIVAGEYDETGPGPPVRTCTHTVTLSLAAADQLEPPGRAAATVSESSRGGP